MKTWVWWHVVCGVALALQPSTDPIYLGRYSRNAALILAGLLVTLPAVWLTTRWAAARLGSWRIPNRAAVGGIVLVLAVVMGLWAVRGASAPAYVVLRLYLTVLMLTAITWAAGSVSVKRIPHWWRWSLPAAVILIALAVGGVIFSFPGVRYVDEAYMASLAWNVAHTGQIKPLIYEYVDTESYALMYIGLGGWLRLFGFGFWVARTFIYAVGLATLAVCWIVARRVYGVFAASSAVLLGVFALAPLNFLRQDVSVALYLALALWAYVVATDRDEARRHVLVGFLVAFAIDGHPNAYRFSFAFGAAYLLEWALLWRARGQFVFYRPIAYLILGGVMGVGAYIGLYTALGDDLLTLAGSPFLAPTKPPPLVLLDQIIEPLYYTPIVFGAAGFGLVVGLQRGDRLVRLLAVVLLVNMLIIATLYGYYRFYYVMQSLSLFVLLAAALLADRDLMGGSAWLRLGVALALVMANTGYLLNRYQNEEFRENFNPALVIGHELREIVPARSTVVAIDPMYFGLVDHVEFVEYATAGWAAGKFDISELDVWQQAAPEYVVMVYGNPAPPPDSLQVYMRSRDMVPITCWDSDRIGRVDLFALPFNQPNRQAPNGQRVPNVAPIETETCQGIS